MSDLLAVLEFKMKNDTIDINALRAICLWAFNNTGEQNTRYSYNQLN
jgi:hypothetical protein